MKYKFIGLAIVAVLMIGCQTTHMGAGSGDIKLSRNVEVYFQTYLANPDAISYAVSTDGQHMGYGVCADGPFACVEESGTVALRSCHGSSEGVPCKIYAVGNDIVWQGIEKSGLTKISTEIGRGPIELSPSTRRKFNKYLDLAYPEYFAASPGANFLAMLSAGTRHV